MKWSRRNILISNDEKFLKINGRQQIKISASSDNTHKDEYKQIYT